MTDAPSLESIGSPEDLRRLPLRDLPKLAAELRRFLLASVARTGGHLAANLGTVELTIALHYVFDTPDDRLVWDVGHQAYAHKILTGRRERMDTLRQQGGLAGFPKRDESPYDPFGAGHSSTSISAALGMALAARHLGIDRKHVAIIGDGAMSAGMAFEALNHAGDLPESQRPDLLVVLNDNEMSISPNVGAMHKYLTRMLSGPVYGGMREGSKRMLDWLPPVRELASRAEEHVKGMFVPGTLFEELGFRYFGPVDGHDVTGLVSVLRNLHAHRGPRLLHVVTRKGQGFPPAEADPCGFHGVSRFELDATGDKLAPARNPATTSAQPSYTQRFSDWIETAARREPKLVAITPAMREGSGLVDFAKHFPQRYFDVGIAEQHAATLAAGLACEGLKPVLAIYSTFLQRAMDQVIHDIALQNLDVTFAIDRAGLVGPDGPTHAGTFDIALLRAVPNLCIACPGDAADLARLLDEALAHPGPAAVRYPRGAAAVLDLPEPQPGRARTLRSSRAGHRVALLNFGALLPVALEVAAALDITLLDMRYAKPLDADALAVLAAAHERWFTLEDHAVAAGAGSAVLEWAAQHAPELHITPLGLPDRFIEQGSREALLADAGLDSSSLIATIQPAMRAFDAGKSCSSGA